MPRRERLVRLRHMLDHAREAVAMANGKTRDDLDSDRKLNLRLFDCWKSSAKPRTERRPMNALNTPRYRGPRLLDCAIG